MTALTLTVEDGIGIVVFDSPGESVNIISRSVKNEFIALFDRLENDPTIRAAVLMSGKPDAFIAGADIEEFLEWRTAAQAESVSREGHALLDRLENLRTPVVAAIHGACLGGGLETSLACAWRIATDHPKTLLALPEVQIGLFPAAGGTGSCTISSIRPSCATLPSSARRNWPMEAGSATNASGRVV